MSVLDRSASSDEEFSKSPAPANEVVSDVEIVEAAVLVDEILSGTSGMEDVEGISRLEVSVDAIKAGGVLVVEEKDEVEKVSDDVEVEVVGKIGVVTDGVARD
jgi:hypothetical protein